MLKKTGITVMTAATLALSGCASDGSFNLDSALVIGVGAAQMAAIDEDTVKQASALSAAEMDKKSRVAPADSNYAKRLAKITKGLKNFGGESFNFKVYLNKQVNAFAMADGTVRVYSGLMDVMPDDQVQAVIFHEIGHVIEEHTYNQLREKIMTDTAFKTLQTAGGTVGDLTSSQLGVLGYTAVNAHFSQSDELEADTFAVRALKLTKKDPYAMKRAIQTLQKGSRSQGSFLSTHPSSEKRIENIELAIKGLK